MLIIIDTKDVDDEMNLDAIRNRNLKMTIQIVGDQKTLAQKILAHEEKETEYKQIRTFGTYISQLVNEKKKITANFCERVESALALKEGWMSTDHTRSVPTNSDDDVKLFAAKYERFSTKDRKVIQDVMDAITHRYELLEDFEQAND